MFLGCKDDVSSRGGVPYAAILRFMSLPLHGMRRCRWTTAWPCTRRAEFRNAIPGLQLLHFTRYITVNELGDFPIDVGVRCSSRAERLGFLHPFQMYRGSLPTRLPSQFMVYLSRYVFSWVSLRPRWQWFITDSFSEGTNLSWSLIQISI